MAVHRVCAPPERIGNTAHIEGVEVVGLGPAHFRERSHARHGDRTSGGHGFERRKPESLVQRRLNQRGAPGDVSLQDLARDMPRKDDPVAEPFGRLLHRGIDGQQAFPFPDDDQPMRDVASDLFKGRDQSLQILVRLYVAHGEQVRSRQRRRRSAQHGPARIDTEVHHCHSARRACEPHEFLRGEGGVAHHQTGAPDDGPEQHPRVGPAHAPDIRCRQVKDVVHRDRQRTPVQQRNVVVRNPQQPGVRWNDAHVLELLPEGIDRRPEGAIRDTRGRRDNARQDVLVAENRESGATPECDKARDDVLDVRADPRASHHPGVDRDVRLLRWQRRSRIHLLDGF